MNNDDTKTTEPTPVSKLLAQWQATGTCALSPETAKALTATANDISRSLEYRLNSFISIEEDERQETDIPGIGRRRVLQRVRY